MSFRIVAESQVFSAGSYAAYFWYGFCFGLAKTKREWARQWLAFSLVTNCLLRNIPNGDLPDLPTASPRLNLGFVSDS